jgi:hypothetical protein
MRYSTSCHPRPELDGLDRTCREGRTIPSRTSRRTRIGYTRERTVKPELLGTVEAGAAKIQEKIDALRWAK